mmetsp:Transcript_3051/g.4666  ORF Transcript_3051/g.4666 Transcript_3051/m.4666 type:complete len:223 (-) Transcript_3051:610-1278(-)
MSVLQSLFGKKVDPKELAQTWKSELRSEDRKLQRQILAIEREEQKVKKEIKDAAKKGEKDACRILAKELVRSRKAKERIYASKAQLNSVSLHLSENLATMRVMGTMQKSSEIMQSMNDLIKMPEVAKVMSTMAREMAKAGLIEDMVEEAISFGESDDLDEAADEEVDKVMNELTSGILSQAGATPSTSVGARKQTAPAAEEEVPADEKEDQDLQSRLAALRS